MMRRKARPGVLRYLAVLLPSIRSTWQTYRGPGWAPALCGSCRPKSLKRDVDDWRASAFAYLAAAERALDDLETSDEWREHQGEAELHIVTDDARWFPFDRRIGWQGDPDRDAIELQRRAFIEGAIWSAARLGKTNIPEVMEGIGKEAILRYRP